ncbi:undecaprenyl-phosphate alpha-N-acetylglucosaminyltransferase [Pectobacterium atrosepticum SCRI1043]|uniref:Undecaprenyl-phosphate alpha-N-acetylglucosaminyl 1-phosphate transferase n=2 Tax=Pectobacterium atrosepticum TaxID=29471 RepID=Q6D7A9_PECAS|nr:undecaprenyl-phosphate alpha-N-acetylglucosaminyltransferase [Pectobacterium atrosepticum]KMK80933.1 undecaprenyl-phosphate alpha-N-acetylglucosaminyl 1-phosphatetransferase [Pectobacterium atrosepticum ICMP 1526]POW30900.1 undecaprenyl-phosphate alpha-N-acetylglucosaminyl 1-phosphate transferase [Pectobacterium atrosepticum]GKV86590.1 undecaprenyl-phosphate alpha-N-acetylglucosaminyl 1-phosphate transferase [Pectobacterium carotovorum subsp. carotovorum]CAG74326.1 undecaprenyl-phosphate alp
MPDAEHLTVDDGAKMQDFIVVFLSAFAALFLARKVATIIGLVDKPCARKKHRGNIPLVGGVSIYCALCILFILHSDWLPDFSLYMVCATLLLVIGVIDDRFDLPVLPRFAVQTMVGGLMMYSGLYLSSLGNVLFGHELLLGGFGYVITLFAVCGAINAFNMIDGIDGLLGSLSCIAFCSLFFLFYSGGERQLGLWSLCMMAATLPYLFLNLGIPLGKKFKVFMGDAGSTVIGFTVLWLLVLASQGETAVMHPVTALWLIALPLIDMIAIMLRRFLRGDSPFKADRGHLHHILMSSGLTSRQSLMVITFAALLLAAVGIISDRNNVSQSMMLSLFFVTFIGYFYFIPRIGKVLQLGRRTHSDRLVAKLSNRTAQRR